MSTIGRLEATASLIAGPVHRRDATEGSAGNTRTEVLQTVERTSAQMLDQILQRYAPETSTSSTVNRLQQLAPNLSTNYQALLEFVAQQDPEAAQRLAETMDSVLAQLQGQGSSGSQPSGQPTRVPTSEQLQFAMEATFTELRAQLADGTVISAESVEIVFSTSLQSAMGVADPLVLDLNDNGFETTDPTGGHDFDILGTGHKVRSATVTGGDALLVYDRNRNGQIDDGTELFGDQNGAIDGFAELAKYDQNADGRIDQNDEIFSSLALFQDRNRNGKTDVGELQSLADSQIASINLNASKVDENTNGNTVDQVATFQRSDGTVGRIGDLFFRYMT